MGRYTAHLDTFTQDNLPPEALQPRFLFDLPELKYPDRLNASVLLERAATEHAARLGVTCGAVRWTWAELLANANRIARVLVEDMGLVAGQRVLLHATNTPWAIAAWWAILRAGGVAVATMPMLRAAELSVIIDKAQISHVLAEAHLAEAVDGACMTTGYVRQVRYFGAGADLETLAAGKDAKFSAVQTAADDVALIAFTSGTTGQPKGCMHYHRDVLAMTDTFSRHILRPCAEDVFCGTPPFAFTFGLGALIVFPAACGARTALSERPGFEGLMDTIEAERVTTLFTAPTGYRTLLRNAEGRDLASLHTCVSAGEHLPQATSDAWLEATGIRPIDGIGATEMIHIFISAAGEAIRPGSTGRVVPGFEACVLDAENRPLLTGEPGRLAVRGPTGCRYLCDDRQRNYVVDGWNITGDIYRQDPEGYFWFVSRADDMIVSSGYNIAAPEVEQALLNHTAVLEAAVVGAPDPERGAICKAFVVLREGEHASEDLKAELQRHVKATIAPYKYPRAVEFVDELPKTITGKLQRYRLKASP